MTKIGELITPTGRLVLPADQLQGEAWLQARRWRFPSDIDPAAIESQSKSSLGPQDPRDYRIGSSDVPSILDLDGVDTPAHVYRAKVYDIRPEVNEAMTWGHLLEASIATEWCRRNRAVIDEVGLLAHVDRPWHQSTIDRRVRECPVYKAGEAADGCLLEVKNMGPFSAARWHAELPDRVLAQIIHQLFVTGYSHAHYACLVGGNQMKQGIVWRARTVEDEELSAFVIGAVEKFRNEHLLTGVEPPWDTNGKPDKMIELDEATHPERVGEIDIEGVGEVMAYAQISRAAGDAADARKAAGAKLRQLAAGREIVTFAGERAYWYGKSTRTNVDLEKLSERYPEAYSDPEVVTETSGHTLYIDKAYKVKKAKA